MLAACAPTFYAARELRFFASVRNVIEHSGSKFLRLIAFSSAHVMSIEYFKCEVKVG